MGTPITSVAWEPCDHPRQFCLCCNPVLALAQRDGVMAESFLRRIHELIRSAFIVVDPQGTDPSTSTRLVTDLHTFLRRLRQERGEDLERLLLEAARRLHDIRLGITNVKVTPDGVEWDAELPPRAAVDMEAVTFADEDDAPPPIEDDDIPPPEED